MNANPPPTIESLLQHTDFVRGLASALLGPGDRAEDVVQDTYTAALRTGPRSADTARGWLGRVVRNRVASLRRREYSRRRYEAQLAPTASVGDPADVLAHEEMRKKVVQALLSLDPRYRAPIVLRYYEGLGPSAIAARLDLPVETVRTQIKRGLAQLRERLDDSFDGRKAWIAALAPLVPPSTASAGIWPWLVGAAAAAGLAGAWFLGAFDDEPQPPAPPQVVERPVEADPSPALRASGTDPKPEAPNRRTRALPQVAWKLAGRVGDMVGSTPGPVHDIAVEAHLITNRRQRALVGTARTDKAGRFEISLRSLAAYAPSELAASSLLVTTPDIPNSRFPPGREVGLHELSHDRRARTLRTNLALYRRNGTVHGRLVGPKGAFVFDAQLHLCDASDPTRVVARGFTNHIGEFMVYVGESAEVAPDGVYVLRAYAPGIGTAEVPDVRIDKTRPVRLGKIQLRAASRRLAGRVVDGAGRGCPGVSVVLVPGAYAPEKLGGVRPVRGSHLSTVVRTDAQGRFDAPAILDGPWSAWVEHRVGASGHERTQAGPPDAELRPGEPAPTLRVPGTMIEVALRDAKGRPTRGASWHAFGWRKADRKVQDALTDLQANGFADLGAFLEAHPPTWRQGSNTMGTPIAAPTGDAHVGLLVEPGSHWIVRAFTDGLETGVGLFAAGQAIQELPLTRRTPATLQLDVTDEAGTPIRTSLTYTLRLSLGRTERRGRIGSGRRLSRLPPGPARIEYEAAGWFLTPDRAFPRLVAGKDTQVSIRAVPAGFLEIEVGLPAGVDAKAWKRTQVRVEQAKGKYRTYARPFLHTQGNAARLVFGGSSPGNAYPHPLRPGRYTVLIKAFGDGDTPGLEGSATADVRAGRGNAVRVDLEEGGAR